MSLDSLRSVQIGGQARGAASEPRFCWFALRVAVGIAWEQKSTDGFAAEFPWSALGRRCRLGPTFSLLAVGLANDGAHPSYRLLHLSCVGRNYQNSDALASPAFPFLFEEKIARRTQRSRRSGSFSWLSTRRVDSLPASVPV